MKKNRIILQDILASDSFYQVNKKLSMQYGILFAAILSELISLDKYFTEEGQKDRGEAFFLRDGVETMEKRFRVGREQRRSVFRELQDSGILKIEKKGIPARYWYRIEYDKLAEILSEEQQVMPSSEAKTTPASEVRTKPASEVETRLTINNNNNKKRKTITMADPQILPSQAEPVKAKKKELPSPKDQALHAARQTIIGTFNRLKQEQFGINFRPEKKDIGIISALARRAVSELPEGASLEQVKDHACLRVLAYNKTVLSPPAGNDAWKNMTLTPQAMLNEWAYNTSWEINGKKVKAEYQEAQIIREQQMERETRALPIQEQPQIPEELDQLMRSLK